MKQHVQKTILLVLLFSLFLFITSCSGGGNSSPSVSDSSVRPTPPTQYEGLSNPLTIDESNIESGKDIYQSNCSSCHGVEGLGDGPVANSLDPIPSNLNIAQELSPDDYLYWRIAEGGIGPPFNSSMPSWKTILSEDQIWALVVFIRSLDG